MKASKAGTTTRILGIDPGTNQMGFALLEVRGRRLSLIEMGIFRMGGMGSQEDKLRKIFEGVQKLIDRHQPEELAVEAPFYGKNVQSMLKLGKAQGVAIAAALSRGLPFTEYSPKRIKKAVTGRGNASKEQVAAMLDQLLGEKLLAETLDATDALGVAVCHHLAMSSPLHQGQGKKGWDDFLRENPGRVKGS